MNISSFCCLLEFFIQSR